MSAGCLFWLQRLQPLFVVVAVGSLGYQLWLVRTRPPKRKKSTVRTVLALSLLVNLLVLGGWVALLIRYR